MLYLNVSPGEKGMERGKSGWSFQVSQMSMKEPLAPLV